MTSESGGSTGVVAIFAILLMVVIAGFIGWRVGLFGGSSSSGGGETHHTLDVNVNSK
jgi:hypothetical protein